MLSSPPTLPPLPCTLGAQLTEALQNLPWLVQVPVALALVGGLILWLAGRRLIRPVTILVGLALGGLLGFLIAPAMMPGIGISPYLGMLAGAATGLTTALLLYQVTTAVTFGSAIGAGCGIAAAAVLGTALTLPASAQTDQPDNPGQLGGGEQPVYAPPPPVWDPRVEPLPEPERGPEGSDVENPGVIRAKPVVKKPAAKPTKPAQPAGGAGTNGGRKPATVKGPAQERQSGGKASPAKTPREPSEPLHEEVGGAVGRVGAFWGAARDAWGEWWETVPAKNRPWIIGATTAGVVAGTVLGLLLPAWSAGAVTALAGAAIWLPSALWLGTAWGAPGFGSKGGGWIGSLSPGGWIAVWLVLAVIGVACQWYGLMPGKAKGKGKGKKKKPKVEEE